MGLFDFVKDAGKKILGKDDEPKKQAPAAATTAAYEEARRGARERRLAAKLVEYVENLGFDVSDLSIRVDGDVATVRGSVGSQAEREKIVLAVGNVEGVAKVDDQMKVAKPEPQGTFYTVKSGDTLSKIAKQHYGNASKYMVIFEANRPLLEDPDKIYPGQVLRIPPQEG